MKITLNNKELRTVFRGIYGFIDAIYCLGEIPTKERPDDDSDGGLDIEPDAPTPPEDHGAEPEAACTLSELAQMCTAIYPARSGSGWKRP